MRKRIISTLVKLAVTVGLFVLLFRPETFGLAADKFGGVTPLALWRELTGVELSNVVVWLLFATVIRLTGLFTGIVRWRLLLRGQDLKMPFWYMTQSWFVGRFIGIFLPGTIGLDGYRLYDSTRYTGEVIKSATVIAVEKLIGFISLTFLVFLTFPLGFRLLNINLPVLLFILAVLGMFVLVSFLLLLVPRAVQVLIAVVPAPAAVRSKVDKLGGAITAYSGRRGLLLAAVACGLWVHLSTCFMFFGTMMAIRAQGTSLLDILFASPIMIYGTVIGPSIGGEGIREIIFVKLLGATSGVAASVLFAHLGWWVGDVVPFLIGAPIFFLRSRPRKEEIQAQLAEARQEMAKAESAAVKIAPEAVADYRRKLMGYALGGIGGGLIAGAAVAIGEASWISSGLGGFTEFSALWWGPLAYGAVFAGFGLAIAAALAFISLLFDRFMSSATVLGMVLGSSVAASTVIALWRFKRDVLMSRPLTMRHLIGFAAVFAGAAIVAALVSAVAGKGIRKAVRGPVAAAVVPVLFLLVVAGGAAYDRLAPASTAPGSVSGAAKATGPNLILIAADALRADYLKLYRAGAVAGTPQLDRFSKDAVFFESAFAQASWTKPSFATIFSGRYPESHTATGKVSMLPDDIVTFPELLRDGGYYTKGFANNPNICAAFNFGQGFLDYTDLKPRLYFGARESASRLSIYQMLRIVRQAVMSRVSGKMSVTDYYQPADVVTREALGWLDSGQAGDRPFFLFVHYMDPHDPFMDHHKPGVGYARSVLQPPTPTGVESRRLDPDKYRQPMIDAYNSEIEFLDGHLGEFLEGLRSRGLYDNSVIVFVADHGEEFYDHEGWWHGQTLFDELVRIPLMVKLPSNAGAGQHNTGFARHIDLAPTLLRLAGLQPDANMPGKPLLEADGSFLNGDIAYVYAENDFENNVLQSVRTRTEKIIHANPDNPRKHAAREFYDLTADPGEKNNLAESGGPRVEGVETLLDGMIAFIKTGAAKPAATVISEEQKQQLDSLGYMGLGELKAGAREHRAHNER